MPTQRQGNKPLITGRDSSVVPQWKEINKAVNRYLRWAVAGGSPGPGIAETMVLLGRDVTLQRLREAAASQLGVPYDTGSV